MKKKDRKINPQFIKGNFVKVYDTDGDIYFYAKAMGKGIIRQKKITNKIDDCLLVKSGICIRPFWVYWDKRRWNTYEI